MLQTLYESGLVGTILFYYLIYISFNQLKFMNNKKYSLILCAVLFSMLIIDDYRDFMDIIFQRTRCLFFLIILQN